VALVALPFTAIGSVAPEVPVDAVTLIVKKVVSGTGTDPSGVTVDCVGNPDEASVQFVVTVRFDAHGNPTTTSDARFKIVDGAWTTSFVPGTGGECDYTETATGGATSTAWTCDYDADEIIIPTPMQELAGGCVHASGSDVGPVHVDYPGDDIAFGQESTITFINTFVPPVEAPAQHAPQLAPQQAPQVVAQPAFTG
jgi:hypothetical protein